MLVLTAPNGTRLRGTLDLIPGVAQVDPDNPRNADGTVNYDGGTEVTWDGQFAVIRELQRVWVDDEYNEWLESELVMTEVETDE